MAPKKSSVAVAGELDQFPFLRLVFQKGPISGQTRDFKPGDKIRVGRVVTGNTVTIKDAGVSSKHLVVQFEYVSELGGKGWTITDLGSSNGTALNGKQLSPSLPALLSEGDIVEIGEQTVIGVNFGVNDGGGVSCSRNTRRNAKKRARGRGVDLKVIHEESEADFSGLKLGGLEEKKASEFENAGEAAAVEKESKAMSRCRSKRLLKKIENAVESQSELSENVSISTTSDSRMTESLVEETTKGTKQGEQRRTRSSRKELVLKDFHSVGIKAEGNTSRKPKKGTLKGGFIEMEERLSDTKVYQKDLLEETMKDLGVAKPGQRRTRSSRKEQTIAPLDDGEELKREGKSSTNAKTSISEAGVAEVVERLSDERVDCEVKNGKDGLMEEIDKVTKQGLRRTRNSRKQVVATEPKRGRKSSKTALASIPETENAELVEILSDERRDCEVKNEKDDGTVDETSKHLGEAKRGGRRTRASKKQVLKDLETPENSISEAQIINPVGRSSENGNDDSRKEPFLAHLNDVEIKKERKSLSPEGGVNEMEERLLPDQWGDFEVKSLEDLEKMTLGEWIAYLEELLPSQIMHQTEKIISVMIQKREKLKDFLLHHSES